MGCPIESVTLFHVETAKQVTANVVELNWNTAYSQIQIGWWKSNLGLPHLTMISEDDHHWNWTKLCKKARKDLSYECIGIQTEDDNRIQGATIYHVKGDSHFDRPRKTIYLERVASAPWNRAKLLEGSELRPIYKGVGTALLQVAIAHSQQLGLDGRVNGVPVPNAVEFYHKLNFQKTDVLNDEGDVLYEIRAHEAAKTLKETKLLYWGKDHEHLYSPH